ncbi:hypothetical protein V6N13_108632 [Hibiscus sabdariffa]
MAPASPGVARPLTTTSLSTPKSQVRFHCLLRSYSLVKESMSRSMKGFLFPTASGSTSRSVMAREEWNIAGRRGSKRGGQCGQITGLTFSFCQCLFASSESSFRDLLRLSGHLPNPLIPLFVISLDPRLCYLCFVW